MAARRNEPRHRVQGEPCPKVLTPFEDARPSSKVSILENPDVFFEDAHPFSKVRNFWCASSRLDH